MESRTPKGRGKRRGAANTPVNDTRTLRKGRRGSSVNTFTAPPSPAKSEPSGGLKRKGRPTDIDLSAAEQRSSKRSRSGSQVPTPNSETPPTDAQGFIECPEPNCNKKYRNANGLKYHQSHAHSGTNSNVSVEDAKEDMDCEDIPLSVMKNNVKKEKESKKDSNKKDKDSEKKNDKSADSVSAKKVKDDASDSKDGKNDSKCDNNSSASKNKKDKDLANSKATVAQSSNNGKLQQIVVSSQGSSSQTIASQVSSASSALLVSTSSPSSLTVSSASSVMQSTTQGDSSKIETANKLVDIKPKITNENAQRVSKPNRPIVPAPTHAVLSNVQVTHSNLSPVMSHTQMSPQLKPIQPKPTIMGEPQNINPALVDLNKDRKKVQKKKPKDGVPNGNNGNQPRVDQPTIKVERSGVIKTNPMPTSKSQMDSQKNVMLKDSNAQRSHLAPNGAKGSETMPHSRPAQNPNLLKVGSPLQVNTPDKGPVSDDVQSPAYSDISDANESASPAAPSDSSPQKQKEEKKKEKAEAPPPVTNEGPSVPHFGMYYIPSPYGMNNMSPGQKGQGPNNPAANTGNTPATKSNNPDNRGTPTQNKDKPLAPEEANKVEKKNESDREQNRPKGIPPHMQGHPPTSMSPQEYQNQQYMYQQHMYLQSMSPQMQYPYNMANGWYPHSMDPGFMRQMMEEQRRGDREGGQGPTKGPERDQDSNRGSDSRGQPGFLSGRKDEGASKSVISPGQQSTGSDRSDSSRKFGDDKSVKDQALRDKQNENHQILKENIELKNEMDKRNFSKQAEEMRRQRMYQEQKKMELARKGESRPENLSKAPATKPIIDHSSRSLSGQHPSSDMSKDSLGKRDTSNNDSKIKDSRDSHSRDSSLSKYSDSGSRSMDDKSKNSGPDRHRAETPTRNPENAKPRPGGSSSKSGSPCSLSNISIASSPSYSPFYSYMQNPHFMGLDPSHPMYRNPNVNPALISGFPSSYIHPSQMAYRPGSDSEDKDKIHKSNPPTSESDPKKVDSGPYYGNMHKIHELSEKGRPKSRNSSPVLGKSADSNSSGYDKHREYSNSPPTQRHVHTHHHTHVLGPGLQPGAPLQGPPAFYPVNDHYSGEYRRM